MELSLEIANAIYNARVSAHIVYEGCLIVDYDLNTLFPIGGLVHCGETLQSALHREVLEKLKVEVLSYELVGIGQESFFCQERGSEIVEHNFIYSCTLANMPQGHCKVIEELRSHSFVPLYWDKIGAFKIYTDMSEFNYEALDISKLVGDVEFNVRISAIIRNEDKILFDTSAYDPKHKVLIGGRMKIGETFETALQREVSEELHANVLKSTFVGVGEDFFSLSLNESMRKKIHFISFVYEVTLDTMDLVFDDGCEGVWLSKEELGQVHMASVLDYL